MAHATPRQPQEEQAKRGVGASIVGSFVSLLGLARSEPLISIISKGSDEVCLGGRAKKRKGSTLFWVVLLAVQGVAERKGVSKGGHVSPHIKQAKRGRAASRQVRKQQRNRQE